MTKLQPGNALVGEAWLRELRISTMDGILPAVVHSARDTQQMFAFFSNRLGCLGSLAVSIIGTILLLFILRGCGGGAHW